MITISTDGRTTSATTVGREFELLMRQFGWTADHEARCQDNARRSVFAVDQAAG